MIIAIPTCHQRVSPVLDSASRLLLVTQKRGQEIERREIVLDALPPETLARCVAELSVNVLLCAAVSEPLRRELERRGIRIQSHLCGEVEPILEAFRRGRLRPDDFPMPGCWKRPGANPSPTP